MPWTLPAPQPGSGSRLFVGHFLFATNRFPSSCKGKACPGCPAGGDLKEFDLHFPEIMGIFLSMADFGGQGFQSIKTAPAIQTGADRMKIPGKEFIGPLPAWPEKRSAGLKLPRVLLAR